MTTGKKPAKAAGKELASSKSTNAEKTVAASIARTVASRLS